MMVQSGIKPHEGLDELLPFDHRPPSGSYLGGEQSRRRGDILFWSARSISLEERLVGDQFKNLKTTRRIT
jgi:hypothetical protein